MIIGGKDKERVRLLEVENKLNKDLYEELIADLKQIQLALIKEGGVGKLTEDPYWKLSHDIGRCMARKDFYK